MCSVVAIPDAGRLPCVVIDTEVSRNHLTTLSRMDLTFRLRQ